MQQLCPKCGTASTFSASAAGTEMPCPKCGAAFIIARVDAPSVYEIAPVTVTETTSARPAPPPGLVPPPITPPAQSQSQSLPQQPTEGLPAGTPPYCTLRLSPFVLEWLPLVLALSILILSFFPWVGAYPGGVRLFSQNAWESLSGTLAANVPSEELQKLETEVAKIVPMNGTMIPYVILVLLLLAMTILEKVFQEPPTVLSVPAPLAWLPGIWPTRHRNIYGITVVLFVLLLLQNWRGFGLETAVARYAAAAQQEELTAADTNTKKQIVQVKIGQKAGQFQVGTSTAFALLMFLHALIVLVTLLKWVHGDRPADQLPRLELHC
ncbi:MAG: hypothetical protein ACRCZF_26000 [Gemmataceae bacterium]